MPASEIFHTGLPRLLIVLSVFLVINGCGAGSGQGLDENGNLLSAATGGETQTDTGGDTGGDSGGASSGNQNATLAWVQTNVFGGVCSQCHTGASAPLGVNWSTESDTCANIDRVSGEISELMEVNSGNPEASYVIWKLNGAGPNGETIVGEQMPLSNPALSDDTIKNISDWISDGTPGCTASKSSDQSYSPGSWSEVWNETLRVCTLCHSTTPASPSCSNDLECPPKGLVLTEDNYFGVVDGRIVVPFDPESSILWDRINTDGRQSALPSEHPVLTQNKLKIIQHWIEGGALFCPEDQVCE